MEFYGENNEKQCHGYSFWITVIRGFEVNETIVIP